VALKLRYSKYSPSTAPILIYLDGEAVPRASFTPVDQGDWNNFTWSEPIALGDIEGGEHTIKFVTDGQQYGVADLDMFVLEVGPLVDLAVPIVAAVTDLPLSPSAEDDLLAWYDFKGDFLQPGLVADRSGNGLDAQVVGNVAASDGVSGSQGILFSGDGYLQAQSNPAAGLTHVTFSLWFKTDHPEANYKLASGAWWSWGPGSGWIMATHMPEFWSDDTLGLYLDPVSNENYFTPGEWIHEVVTYDGERIKEYTNGALINDWPTTGAAIGQGQALVVGAWPPYSAYNFQGSLDEFRIYARCLTHEEVLELYNEGR
jgi:hypothetical protein